MTTIHRTFLDSLSPGRRRLLLGLFLAANLLTSVGHGISQQEVPFNPDDYLCAEGTLQVTSEGSGQAGYPDAPLGSRLALRLSCLSQSTRSPLAPSNITVQWAVGSGGGAVNGGSTATAQSRDGLAWVNWQLGPAVGTQTVTAQASGQAQMFTATAAPAAGGGTCSSPIAGTGTDFGAERLVDGNETWSLSGSPYRGAAVRLHSGTLTIQPGVHVCVTRFEVELGAQVVARGTAQAPVHLASAAPTTQPMSISFHGGVVGVPVSSSDFAHVRGSGVTYIGASNYGLSISDSLFQVSPAQRALSSCVTVWISTSSTMAPPTSIRRTVFDGYGASAAACERAAIDIYEAAQPSAGAQVFAGRVSGAVGDGVHVQGGDQPVSWSFEQCEVAGGSGHGMVLETNVVGIAGCSFSGNAGHAVHNSRPASFTAPARGNWWGDAAGPLGSLGDGVSAGVDAGQPLPAAPALGY